MSNPVFGKYASYYNLLNRDKDYAGEAEYIDALIRGFVPGASTLLELGCGTGVHARIFHDMGYNVHGVDFSEDMLTVARRHCDQTLDSGLSFSEGDLRSIRLGKKYDVVVSLFHVISYQTTNDDIAAAFATARAHLEDGGIFIFDCWYGPAVLTERPSVRVRRLADQSVSVVRIAEPVMDYSSNCVDVHYQIMVTENDSGHTETLEEMHRMRYLFFPEILGLFEANGMRLVSAREMLSGKQLGPDTWGACFVGRV